MNSVQEERFVVFVRFDPSHADPSAEAGERPLASCSSYAEARRIRRACRAVGGEFVIRYIGPAGGGD